MPANAFITNSKSSKLKKRLGELRSEVIMAIENQLK